VVNVHIVVFWTVTPMVLGMAVIVLEECSVSILRVPEDGGNMFLQGIGILFQYYVVYQLRR
jgi:hypothetical protein